ncbi:hypothetical protein AMES_5466 [Amycolatopsis mediterranei S699]|uniref:Resolvase/invertase-type recombinase catalytic domain-containing protein n=2 Tax=Amycolatopsis mediterranei TaxID=33910 RepID=A0A0H3D9J3_AMYMU|nr:hypothetical protein [Amycolatopsis mediterranei]ADJ47291.1 hypothetical protein AMED_5533 [Amycolatopsis mediterranei U32]AEK44118.1 hypothetical protein RAM_28205 [Amycolatopsis mediterranei S699]AFO79002.1 hypothetical protein AMES_5466 [Amycolatopsis mediterranei S699]AGT86130.1 hypothetical protein B737_5466 [Amycolatopsis mediterranei RB]KDO12522.1 hypothetical protein DV26_02435 [Amycolatopsis mediterranei]
MANGIVAVYFDAGTSRRVPWTQRPHAARLMAEIAGSDKTIDAIVVGEYERAFTGSQFATLYAWCTRHGIQLWLPETGGPVDLADRDHRALRRSGPTDRTGRAAAPVSGC